MVHGKELSFRDGLGKENKDLLGKGHGMGTIFFGMVYGKEISLRDGLWEGNIFKNPHYPIPDPQNSL